MSRRASWLMSKRPSPVTQMAGADNGPGQVLEAPESRRPAPARPILVIGESQPDSQILIELQEENDRLKREVEWLRAQLRQPFDSLDAAEIVALLVQHCAEDMREAIAAGLHESQGPPGSLSPPDGDGWPASCGLTTNWRLPRK